MMIKQSKRKLTIKQQLLISFALLILTGTLALALPPASRNGGSCGLDTALFTATSALCVTGLTVTDTYTQWSFFGQLVLLILMELGGLGIMSLVSLLFFALRKQMDFRKLMVLAQSLGTDDYRLLLGIQQRLLIGSAIIQLAGALLLALWFRFHYGWSHSLWLGIFHSVSAFCNAGFDLFGFVEPGIGYSLFQQDPVVCIITALLILSGGIGFIVWNDLLECRSGKKCTIYSRLVLELTCILVVAGTLGFFLLERHNPDTLAGLPLQYQLLQAFFQSVTTRTAGFAAISQSALTDSGQVLTLILMFIGGSSVSTAGGMKTVTFFLLVLFLWNRLRERNYVHVFHRAITDDQILNAVSIFSFMIILTILGTMALCCISHVTFLPALFEIISALATVGLSTGITPTLGAGARLLLVLFMYIGRMGILTFALGLWSQGSKTPDYSYPKAVLLVG